MNNRLTQTERISFLKMALLFEGGLLVVALATGWLVDIPVWEKVRFSWQSLIQGLLLTVPMLIFLAVAQLSQSEKFVEIRKLLKVVLGRPLSACRFLDLCFLALLAGVSEEFLFRGVIEPLLQSGGPMTALVITNLLFGLCHSVTLTYFVLATLLGVYLSTTVWWSDPPNLLIPTFCHSLYDLVAFVVVRQSFLQEMEQVSHQNSSAEN